MKTTQYIIACDYLPGHTMGIMRKTVCEKKYWVLVEQHDNSDHPVYGWFQHRFPARGAAAVYALRMVEIRTKDGKCSYCEEAKP